MRGVLLPVTLTSAWCVQVWSFALLKNETCLVTGSSDLELRVYSLSNGESSGGGGGEEGARLGSKRGPEDSGSRVRLHLMPLCYSLFLLYYILQAVYSYCVVRQLPMG